MNQKKRKQNLLFEKLVEQSFIIQLYADFYPKFYILEWLLKNALIETIKETKGDLWFQDQINDPKRLKVISEELEIMRTRMKQDKLITENIFLRDGNLGFWVEFFSKDVYKELKGCPINIFFYAPKGLKRKEIYNKLYEIKEFRNCVYHHKNIFTRSIESNIENLNYLKNINSDLDLIINSIDPSALSILGKDNFESSLKNVSEFYNIK